MLLAQHTLVQNEAIMALTVLTRICQTECEELLIEVNFGRNLCNFFTARTHITDIYIILNAFTLLDSVLLSGAVLKIILEKYQTLTQTHNRILNQSFTRAISERLKKHLKDCELAAPLEMLKECDNAEVRTRAIVLQEELLRMND